MSLNGIKQQLTSTRPAGVVGPKYLRLAPPESINLHRTLWARNHPRIPRVAWWPLQGVALARWTTRRAAVETRLWVDHCAAAIEESEGIPRDEQFKSVMRLARRHAIHPSETYELGLYRQGGASSWADFVYDRESGAFNEWRSTRFASLGEYLEGIRTLSNKPRLTSLSEGWGIGTPTTLLRVDRADPAAASKILGLAFREGKLFLKPTSGSAGRGAFAIRVDAGSPDGLAVRTWGDLSWTVVETEQYVTGQLGKVAYLVQRPLISDDFFRSFSAGWNQDVVTLRIITNSERSGLDPVWHALLELPRTPVDGGRLSYFLLPVDVLSGRVRSPYEPSWMAGTRASADPNLRALVGSEVPGWAAILKALSRGHQALSGVASISWDVALTRDGPVLLEGNSGFALVRPQAMAGPLLVNCGRHPRPPMAR